jgi:hypothetical protein
MASTRNRNTPGNYCCEQATYRHSEQYTLYPNSQYGAAFHTNWAGNGLMPGQIPGNKLSHNAADTESFLFGINSTNLVNPAPIFHPEIAQLSQVNIYKTRPTLMPEPLVQSKTQRPYPTPM